VSKFTLIQFQYSAFSTPLGSLYLSYGLEKENIDFDLKICPVYKYGLNLEKLYSLLTQSGDIIAIGCWSDFLPHVIIALDRIKKKFPSKIIILGGIGPTEVAEQILTRFQFINFIIKGCGVYALPKLIKKVMDRDTALSDIEGLVFRSNAGVISNYYSGYHLNIPNLPAYHRLENIQSYFDFPIFTSFGCPYQCTFCNIQSVFPKKVAYRDLNQVLDEIKIIKKMKNNKPFEIGICDEGFIVDRERVVKFCKLLMSKKSHIKWRCYGRVDRMDEELLKIMSRSGCVSIFYGIESGSNRILGKIKKGFTIEEAMKTLFLSKKYIKAVMASFIYLYPFEDLQSFKETLFFVKYLRHKEIKTNLQPLTPTKDSEIYFEFRKKLFFPREAQSPCRPGISMLTRKCAKLITNNPEVFYYHYYYNFSGFNKIQRMARQLKI
jgi:anaerobic magnesium-protoporphyrin IX monomethyl ester cyclase